MIDTSVALDFTGGSESSDSDSEGNGLKKKAGDEEDEEKQFDRLVETVCATGSGDDNQSNHAGDDRDDAVTLDTSRDAEKSFITDDCDDEMVLSFEKGLSFCTYLSFKQES